MLQVVLVVAMLGSPESGDAPAASRCAPQVEAFIAAAKKVDAAWPWQGLIAEAMPALECGRAIAPSLVAHLRYDGRETAELDLHVEQQVELALCRLFGVLEESGKTVLGVRSPERDNVEVKRYWQRRVHQDALGDE